MGVRTGRVVQKNLIAIDDDSLEVGKVVTIFDDEDDEGVELSPEDERELIDRLQNDEFVDADVVIAELKERFGEGPTR